MITIRAVGLYNFKKRFAPFVRDGSKRHTIRAKRAHPDKPGNTLHLYTGLRQKSTELLGRSICLRVEHVAISAGQQVFVDGVELSAAEKNALAFCDGFRSRGVDHAFEEMMEFWEGRLPFTGDIIHWSKQLVRLEADLVEKWRTLTNGDPDRMLSMLAFAEMMLLVLDDRSRDGVRN